MSDRSLPDGVRELIVAHHDDPRGRLFAIEQFGPIPFVPVRMFMICDVPGDQVRARHAVSCHEFLWMLRGTCTVTVDDGAKSVTLPLKVGGPGLLVSTGVWMELRAFSADGALSVFASKTYAETRYFDTPQPSLIARFD